MSKPTTIVCDTVRGWGGWRLESGEFSVGLAPQIGGRIISMVWRDTELLFVQQEHAGETFAFGPDDDLRTRKAEMGFRLWGGNKTWLSPQNAWVDDIPPLDLDAAPYDVTREDDAIVMTSPVCRETGARIVRRVALDDQALLLDETLINASDRPLRRGIWSVTQLLRPFEVFVPSPDMRPYPEEGDSMCLCAQFTSRESEWTKIDCTAPAHFKYGGLVDQGVILARRPLDDGLLQFAAYFAAQPDADFAHSAQVEIYNSPTFPYLEVEIHAPLVRLAPGESTTLRQR